MISDPNFRKARSRYFFQPNQWTGASAGKRSIPDTICIFPGVPLPSSESARAFSENQWNQDRKAPVIMGRGMIAGNTPVLQGWWDRKKHHCVTE